MANKIFLISAICTIIIVPLTLLLWFRPRSPKEERRGKIKNQIRVTTNNTFPIFGQIGVEAEMGDHLVSVEVTNISQKRHQVTGWAINTGNGNNIFVIDPIHWDPKLPRWIEPGETLNFHMPASEIREISKSQKVPFSKMKPWVAFGDGSKVWSKKSVPLE